MIYLLNSKYLIPFRNFFYRDMCNKVMKTTWKLGNDKKFDNEFLEVGWLRVG